jgi:ribose 5-phosphate isomerase B
MKIYLGTDHAGFDLKESVKAYLLREGFDVVDCGAEIYDKDDDYPDFVSKAARGVAENIDDRGIVFGKSGAGECIVANKVPGIRAFLGINEENVALARQHNDANVISLGSQFVSNEKANELAKLFLTTPFSNEERHKRRIKKISKLEK